MPWPLQIVGDCLTVLRQVKNQSATGTTASGWRRIGVRGRSGAEELGFGDRSAADLGIMTLGAVEARRKIGMELSASPGTIVLAAVHVAGGVGMFAEAGVQRIEVI